MFSVIFVSSVDCQYKLKHFGFIRSVPLKVAAEDLIRENASC